MLTAFEETSGGPRLGPAFLDCGAYSVLTGFWESLPITDYVGFVHQHHQSFGIIASPDVIGSAPLTLENLEAFIQTAKQKKVWSKIKHKVIVTYHIGDRDFGTMTTMLDVAWKAGIRWLAVGGIVTPGTNKQQRAIGISETMKAAYRHNKKWKIHLFGGYTPDLIRTFKPDSVDSSTYIWAAKVLGMVGYRGWEMFKLNVDRKSEKVQLAQIMDRMLEMGYVPEGREEELHEGFRGMPDGVRLWLVNALGVVAFEHFVREHLMRPDFKFWITIDTGMPYAVMRYAPIIRELFWEAWRDRGLLAYPSFWDGPGLEPKCTPILEHIIHE
jgi:hypothetical protein